MRSPAISGRLRDFSRVQAQFRLVPTGNFAPQTTACTSSMAGNSGKNTLDMEKKKQVQQNRKYQERYQGHREQVDAASHRF